MSLKNADRLRTSRPDLLVPSEAIRPDHWLLLEQVVKDSDSRIVLYVSDEDAAEARELFPTVPVGEIDNQIGRIRRQCVN